MKNNGFTPDGFLTWWTCAERTHIEECRSRLEAIKMAGVMPETRRPIACLRDAVDEVVGTKHVMVRSLANANGLQVTAEQKGADQNHYTGQMVFHLQSDGVRVQSLNGPLPWSLTQKINEKYEAAYLYYAAASVGRILRAAACIRLSGVGVRPGGGVYWVHGDSLPQWMQVRDAVVRAATRGRTEVFVIEHQLTTEAAKAVYSGLHQEVEAEIGDILKDLGAAGKRACQSRQDQATLLLEKIEKYEAILSQDLESLRNKAEAARASAHTAALLAVTATS